jgi:hypothetical protein
MTNSTDQIQARGVLRVFGFEDQPFSVTVIPRSVRWRGVRASALFLAGLIPGVALAILPPHAVWPLLGLGAGTSLGLLKWSERFTLVELSATCPRCQAPITRQGPGRFRPAGSVDCSKCNHTSQISLPPGALPG